MRYRQITYAERYTLALLRQQGLPPAGIARVLGRHRSTIGRELRRNRTAHDGCYRPQVADWYARGGKRPITARPHAAEARTRVGHWEADTMLGAGQAGPCVLTLVERKTGYVALGKLPIRRSAEVNARATRLIRAQPRRVHTITADNGTEFHEYAALERATGTRFYFATPHHAWERGTNENTNGLLRQYLPKGASMAHLTQQDCNRLARQLNRRPRKRLGYRTPEECYVP